MPESVPIKSASVTLEIIDTLHELEGAGVSELAEELNMPTSTIYDHLNTLEQEEYLVKEQGTYYVGTRFLGIGSRARARFGIFDVARSEVDNLAKETGEYANLMIEEHGYGVYLYSARGREAVRLDTHSGMRVPLHTTALGKTILSSRSRQEVEAILDRHGMPKFTENSITDRKKLFDELNDVKKQGFAFDDEERVKGMRCVAVPITNADDQAVAALSVSGPKRRMGGERFREDILELVRKSANIVEVNLTFS